MVRPVGQRRVAARLVHRTGPDAGHVDVPGEGTVGPCRGRAKDQARRKTGRQ